MLLDDSWLQEPPNILKDMIILHSKGKNISSNKGGCLRKKKKQSTDITSSLVMKNSVFIIKP